MATRRLLLASAWIYTLSGQREAAAEAMAAIELMGRLDEQLLPDGFSSIEAGLVTLRGFVMWGDVGAGMRSFPAGSRARRAGIAMAAGHLRQPRPSDVSHGRFR